CEHPVAAWKNCFGARVAQRRILPAHAIEAQPLETCSDFQGSQPSLWHHRTTLVFTGQDDCARHIEPAGSNVRQVLISDSLALTVVSHIGKLGARAERSG